MSYQFRHVGTTRRRMTIKENVNGHGVSNREIMYNRTVG